MKRIIRLSFLLTALLAFGLLLAGCTPGFTIADGNGGLVVGQSYTLAKGETLHNDLTVIGGNATMEKGSKVEGDVAVIGGTVTINGEIDGSVSIIGGSTYINDDALVTGDVVTLGGSVHKTEKATIEGNETTNPTPDHPTPLTAVPAPMMNVNFDPVTGPLMAIFQALAVAALAVLISLFAPMPLERTGQTAFRQPFAAGGVGCLTIIIISIMAITIILLPVSALGFIAAVVAGLFGWAALGLMLGRQIAIWLKQPWTDPINAGVGTLVLSLVSSMLNLIWCVGFPIYVIISLIGIGAVVLTRFGTQPYLGGLVTSSPRPAGPYYNPPSPYVNESGSARIYETPDEPSDNPPIDPREIP